METVTMETVNTETECPALENTHAGRTVSAGRLTAQDPGNVTTKSVTVQERYKT